MNIIIASSPWSEKQHIIYHCPNQLKNRLYFIIANTGLTFLTWKIRWWCWQGLQLALLQSNWNIFNTKPQKSWSFLLKCIIYSDQFMISINILVINWRYWPILTTTAEVAEAVKVIKKITIVSNFGKRSTVLEGRIVSQLLGPSTWLVLYQTWRDEKWSWPLWDLNSGSTLPREMLAKLFVWHTNSYTNSLPSPPKQQQQ